MNSKECLKHICDECQINAGKIQVACPFRSISNEYCDKYETIKQDLDRLEQIEKELKDGTLSDGYHTFNDLYLQRMYLFATIVNQNKQLAWKSLKHEDGELCFGGDWFIVGIDTPKGSYTYHYETNYWSLFDCQELEVAKHWDGHTSKDVDRLLSLDHDAFDQLEKENKELKASYESLKKDYWELDKVEEDILQKFFVQGQVISAIQDGIVKKIENETIYEDVSPLCEVTISINKKIFDMLFEKKEVLDSE